MNIDQKNIEKGALPEILPKFHPNSISYLSELNSSRMYAEAWSNKRSKGRVNRREIGHDGYLTTLKYGETQKRRKIDKVRFDSFIVADSVNFKLQSTSLYDPMKAFIHMGGIQTNSILNQTIKATSRFVKAQQILPVTDFHSEDYLPETLELGLEELNLSQDEISGKYYFEISTNSNDISNQHQQKLLLQILGRDNIFKKLQLLNKAGRKSIVCLFESPDYITKTLQGASTSLAIPGLCVAWPFHETLVFDFAGAPEEYSNACLLGTLINATEDLAISESWSDKLQIDRYV